MMSIQFEIRCIDHTEFAKIQSSSAREAFWKRRKIPCVYFKPSKIDHVDIFDLCSLKNMFRYWKNLAKSKILLKRSKILEKIAQNRKIWLKT